MDNKIKLYYDKYLKYVIHLSTIIFSSIYIFVFLLSNNIESLNFIKESFRGTLFLIVLIGVNVFIPLNWYIMYKNNRNQKKLNLIKYLCLIVTIFIFIISIFQMMIFLIFTLGSSWQILP